MLFNEKPQKRVKICGFEAKRAKIIKEYCTMNDKKLRRLCKTELLWIIRDQEAEILELKDKLKELGWEEPISENDKAEVEINDESGSSDDRTDRA